MERVTPETYSLKPDEREFRDDVLRILRTWSKEKIASLPARAAVPPELAHLTPEQLGASLQYAISIFEEFIHEDEYGELKKLVIERIGEFAIESTRVQAPKGNVV
jgi:hypothetical protein